MKIKQNVRNAVNRALAPITRKYHRDFPMDELFRACTDNGLQPVMEDGRPWSGVVCGTDGRAAFDLVSDGQPLDNAALMVGKSKLDLRYWPSSGRLTLWGDRDKLMRVTANLIGNAIKFTPQGGIIDVELSSDENVITLSVTNTGPGLRPDEVARLFKKYERLEEHLEIEGSGLGLSIVKDIIDLHNGHITVRSELGKDTEFKVVLPKDLRKRTDVPR